MLVSFSLALNSLKILKEKKKENVSLLMNFIVRLRRHKLLTEQSVNTSQSQHPWIECEGSKFLVENVRLEVKRTCVCPLEEVPPFNQSFLTINKVNI